ncbi:hypothetical protein [Ruminococcus sp. HUN007]|uniref:hypothetical protein n=1 Tax=Ruminococcus sp. HUN007 TaxID=1514668 RepID=UPI0005D19220|nr:hypothetical protein [Ruminococcus sp. HUN007]
MNVYGIIKKYIDEYDFDDLLAIGAPNDEYDLETERISQRINIQSSVLEIAETISDVFLHSMCSVVKADVTNPDHFLEVAKKIKNELNTGLPK